jgi:hypothetical protein
MSDGNEEPVIYMSQDPLRTPALPTLRPTLPSLGTDRSLVMLATAPTAR